MNFHPHHLTDEGDTLTCKAKRTSAANRDGSGLPGAADGRRAFATRGVTGDGEGSGAPSRRTRLALAGLLAVALCALLAVNAASALASSPRPYESQLTEANGAAFTEPYGLAVDGSDNLWVADVGPGLIDKFDSAGTFLAQGNGEGHWSGEYTRSIAFSNASNKLYLADSEADDLWVLNADTSFNSDITGPWGSGCCFVYTAADNSGGATDGDLYVSGQEHSVYRIDGSGAAAPFSAGAPYIEGAKLTGTPSESFGGEPSGLATDAGGDLYVATEAAVDEFKPSGEFIRAFTEANGAPFGSVAAVASDPTNGNVLIADAANGAIDEFGPSGAFLGQLTEANGEPLGSVQGLAVDSSGTLYAANGSNALVNVFGPAATLILPQVTTGAATPGPDGTTATLAGHLDPAGGGEGTGCIFEYGTDSSYGQTASCEPPPPYATPADVVAQLTNLTPATTYHYRLSAENAGGETHGEDRTFTTPSAPAIEITAAGKVGAEEATLLAQIDPHGLPTTYHFEYGTTTGYGTSVPVPDALAGSGFSDVIVSQQITGLQPSTLYHFRAVATNEIETTFGLDQTFFTAPAACSNEAARQGPSTRLPNCRAYEQLTPVNKGDASDLFVTETTFNGTYAFATRESGYSSASGDQFLFPSQEASFAGGVSSGSVYVLERDPERGEWTTAAVSPPGLGVQRLRSVIFDPADFSRLAVRSEVGQQLFAAPAKFYNLAGPPAGPYATLTSAESRTAHGNGVAGGSADLSHIIVASRDHTLVPAAAGLDEKSNALYDFVEGNPRLLDVNSGGSLLSPCGAALGQGFDVPGGTHDAVSADGSKVFFTAPDPRGEGPGCWNGDASPQENPPQLYMRLNGATTVEISAPEAGIEEAGHAPIPYPAVYVGASADGSRVFFMTRTELTKDDEGLHGPELYEYNTESGTLSRISSGESGQAEGDVSFVPAISSDGSTVYFAALGALTPGLPPLEAGAYGIGQAYLYRYDTATGKTAYVAKVGRREYPQREAFVSVWWQEGNPSLVEDSYPHEVGLDTQANWYTTADGRYLVFASNESLTGYDSTPPSGTHCLGFQAAASPARCAEVFRYSVADEESGGAPLSCVSCAPPGVPTLDNSQFVSGARNKAPAGTPPRPISEDGAYVFFDTVAALTPNAAAGKMHVYQWHDGTISLISSPSDTGNAFFLDSSPNGRDVFFGSHAQLAPSDTDQSGDLYDARIGGGFAGVTAPQCTGTGCQGVPSAPPSFATPAGTTYHGPGNVKERRCPKGKVRRHGRCLKVHHRKHKRHHRRHQRAAKTNRRAGR